MESRQRDDSLSKSDSLVAEKQAHGLIAGNTTFNINADLRNRENNAESPAAVARQKKQTFSTVGESSAFGNGVGEQGKRGSLGKGDSASAEGE